MFPNAASRVTPSCAFTGGGDEADEARGALGTTVLHSSSRSRPRSVTIVLVVVEGSRAPPPRRFGFGPVIRIASRRANSNGNPVAGDPRRR